MPPDSPPIPRSAPLLGAVLLLGLILGGIFVPAVAVADDEDTERRNHEAWEAETKEAIRLGEFEFKPIKIVPSPIDGVYVGHFSFINKRQKPIMVYGFHPPDDGKFIPRFEEFEFRSKGVWKKVPVFYCGTGLQTFPMQPGVPYEFISYLGSFKEQKTPLTGRIGVSDFFSESFVLDWKKDRRAGAFVAARKANFQKTREAFVKAGFKPELLKKDDFCKRLLRSLLTPATPADAHGFAPFKGDLNVIPEVEINGSIRIDFDSTDDQYRGWWNLNPDKFTPEWFRTKARTHADARPYGDDGLRMELEEDGPSPWGRDNHLYLSIIYKPDGELPSPEQAKRHFLKMLDRLEPWLTDSKPAPR